MVGHPALCDTLYVYVCRYIGLYESHMNLLNGSASAALDVFLQEEQDLAYLGTVQYTHSRQHLLMSCYALHVLVAWGSGCRCCAASQGLVLWWSCVKQIRCSFNDV